MVSQLHAELAECQQKSAEATESMQGAMRAQADRAEQQLSQAGTDLEEAREESEQVLALSDYDSNISLIFELTCSIIWLQIIAQMACKAAAQECLQFALPPCTLSCLNSSQFLRAPACYCEQG